MCFHIWCCYTNVVSFFFFFFWGGGGTFIKQEWTLNLCFMSCLEIIVCIHIFSVSYRYSYQTCFASHEVNIIPWCALYICILLAHILLYTGSNYLSEKLLMACITITKMNGDYGCWCPALSNTFVDFYNEISVNYLLLYAQPSTLQDMGREHKQPYPFPICCLAAKWWNLYM